MKRLYKHIARGTYVYMQKKQLTKSMSKKSYDSWSYGYKTHYWSQSSKAKDHPQALDIRIKLQDKWNTKGLLYYKVIQKRPKALIWGLNIPELLYTDFVIQHNLYSNSIYDTSDVWSVQTK